MSKQEDTKKAVERAWELHRALEEARTETEKSEYEKARRLREADQREDSDDNG